MEHLSLKYDGPAFKDGTMDVYMLAPALLDFGNAVKETNRIVNGPKSDIRIEVQSDFETGSFDISFAISFVEQVKTFIESDSAKGAVAVASLLIAYLRVRKFLKGNAATKIVRNETNYNLTIINQEGGKITVPIHMDHMLENEAVRKSMRNVVAKPLKKPGIESVTLSSAREKSSVIVTKDEAKFITGVEPEVETLTSTQTIGLTVISPQFESRKWKFRHGQSVRWAEIRDEGFWQDVEKHRKVFGKGDILIVDLETRQRFKGGELESEEIITYVHEHRSGPEQQEIDLWSPSTPSIGSSTPLLPPGEGKKET